MEGDYGYALSPPFWRFMYCNSRCAVVEVLHLRSRTADAGKKRSPQMRQCELWISVGVGKTLANHGFYTETKERIARRSSTGGATLEMCKLYMTWICATESI
uniref:Lipocalin n=1 Tax=Rhipicephalus zambeziensis TaxID=60191 RepID=A0A224YEM7_9ACAR